MTSQIVRTERLELTPGTLQLVRAELSDRARFGELLSARVPDEWPPDLYDIDATRYALALLEQQGENEWGLRYFVCVDVAAGERILIGVGGYKGPPDATGTVEIGYSVLAEFQRQGFATEATRGLLSFAFSHSSVNRVIAETLPDLAASIGVLEKSGFAFAGEGSENGVIRYEMRREQLRG